MVPTLGLVIMAGVEPAFVLEPKSKGKDGEEVLGEGVAGAGKALNVCGVLFVQRDHREAVVFVELEPSDGEAGASGDSECELCCKRKKRDESEPHRDRRSPPPSKPTLGMLKNSFPPVSGFQPM